MVFNFLIADLTNSPSRLPSSSTRGTQTGGAIKLLPRPRGRFDPRLDAQVEVELHGHKIRLLAEIKNVGRRPALAQIKEQLVKVLAEQFPGYLPLLVAPYITEAMAEECRRIDLPFADTAGNLSYEPRPLSFTSLDGPDQITWCGRRRGLPPQV